VVMVLAVVSVLYGALLAIGQNDMRRLIAYTSISHFGFIVLGIFAMTTQSQAGSTLYMFNHGLSTGALFLISGFLISRRGSKMISDYGGVEKVAPILAGTFLLAGLSSLSLPGLSPFVSEFLVLAGTFTRSIPYAVVGTLGIVLAAIYILLMYQRTMTGPERESTRAIPDLRRREVAAVAPLLAILVFLGFYPQPALNVINPMVKNVLTHVGRTDPPPTIGAQGGGR
jgi:NADH-quinone oxidoreductase subunit M